MGELTLSYFAKTFVYFYEWSLIWNKHLRIGTPEVTVHH